MKRLGLLLMVSTFIVVFFAQLTMTKKNEDVTTLKNHGDYEFPENVKAIIDKSCYGCHSEDGRSDKAKDKLRWDKMDEYDKEKLVSVMDAIIEVIEKQEMPPEKFLEKMPDAKPSEEEYASLKEWAEQQADKLLE